MRSLLAPCVLRMISLFRRHYFKVNVEAVNQFIANSNGRRGTPPGVGHRMSARLPATRGRAVNSYDECQDLGWLGNEEIRINLEREKRTEHVE